MSRGIEESGAARELLWAGFRVLTSVHAGSPATHVIPAKAGIHCATDREWTPAFAGVTTRVVFIGSPGQKAHDNFSVILTQELTARHRTPDTRDLTPETCPQSSPLGWSGEGGRAFLKRRDFHTNSLSHRQFLSRGQLVTTLAQP